MPGLLVTSAELRNSLSLAFVFSEPVEKDKLLLSNLEMGQACMLSHIL